MSKSKNVSQLVKEYSLKDKSRTGRSTDELAVQEQDSGANVLRPGRAEVDRLPHSEYGAIWIDAVRRKNTAV